MTSNNPFSAVDLILLRFKEGQLFTYLIQLSAKHFYKQWAFPGSLVKDDETLETSAGRIYQEASGNTELYLEQLYTFSDPKRDPRSRSISTTYLGFPKKEDQHFHPCSKYFQGDWKEVKKIDRLAYNHNEILRVAIERVAAKLEYTTLAFFLLPSSFTLTELQELYEYFLKKPIDKRNFRKKILSLSIIEETGYMRTGEKSRPAKLYHPTKNGLTSISLFS